MSSRLIKIHKSSRQLELYEGSALLRRFPVAIGKAGTPTPVGRFTIAEKRLNPGGVFGSRWLGLSKPGYGIHGTSDPSSIGKAISKGCIRMYNYHVEEIFRNVEVGTPVIIEP